MSEPTEEARPRSAYREASKIVQDALVAKYERLGQSPPRFPAEPFRRWTPRVARKAAT